MCIHGLRIKVPPWPTTLSDHKVATRLCYELLINYNGVLTD